MKSPAVTEADLAAVVVRWLEERGFDVYQEVELERQGIRADIVARRGPELTIVETKTSASLALLGQVMERRRFAHRVYAASPVKRGPFVDACKEMGIGVLAVHVGGPGMYTPYKGSMAIPLDPPSVTEIEPSRRWNARPLKLASRLRPEHKTACPAGSPTGGHWSRWRDTCAQLAAVVAREPGLSLREALSPDRMRHHYASLASARSSLMTDIRAGAIPGVRFDDDSKLWPGPHKETA